MKPSLGCHSSHAASSISQMQKTIQSAYDNASGGWNTPDTWHACGLLQSHMHVRSRRSGRINKVRRIWDLWWRPIDQLGADCLRHSEVPIDIITKSELRQNYCITEDKLWHLTLTITVAPFTGLWVQTRQSDCDPVLSADGKSHFVLSPPTKNC